MSMWAVRFGLLAGAMGTTDLWPNYAFLASIGYSRDSFQDTDRWNSPAPLTVCP